MQFSYIFLQIHLNFPFLKVYSCSLKKNRCILRTQKNGRQDIWCKLPISCFLHKSLVYSLQASEISGHGRSARFSEKETRSAGLFLRRKSTRPVSPFLRTLQTAHGLISRLPEANRPKICVENMIWEAYTKCPVDHSSEFEEYIDSS
jgi:hypothetical protein